MITGKTVREFLNYDPLTGIFTWQKPSGRASVGMIAGRLDSGGYRQIQLKGRYYLAHRLAWLYVNDEWPLGQIDHRNRVKDDNRIENLRLATPAQNGANRGSFHEGQKGTTRLPSGKWQAQIRFSGNVRYLGIFPNEAEAHAAYMAVAVSLYGEFASA